MVNRALDVNSKTVDGYTADIAMTVRGSNWLWAVTALMAFSTIVFYAHSFTKPRSDRIFHYITASVTFVAAIAYFSMASNLGWASVNVQYIRSNPKVSGLTRQIFYVRYIDW
jgi:bacteriorhodopsin